MVKLKSDSVKLKHRVKELHIQIAKRDEELKSAGLRVSNKPENTPELDP